MAKEKITATELEKRVSKALRSLDIEEVVDRLENYCEAVTMRGAVEGSEWKALVEEIYGQDRSHGPEHIYDVVKNAKLMLKSRNLSREVMLGITFHDIGLADERKYHGEVGKELWNIITNMAVTDISDKEREAVGDSILCHRGSYKGELPSRTAEIVSSADRGVPKSLEKLIKRAILYRLDDKDKKDMSDESVLKDSLDHITAKYGKGGYANFPPLYRNFYKKEIVSIQNDIANAKPFDFLIVLEECRKNGKRK